MPKHGKKYVEASKLIDRAAQYEVSEAIELAKKTATAKFDETVEVAFRLGVDPRQSDQQIRGAVVLPHGTGKSQTVLVFAKGEKAKEAEEAGADFVGAEDMVAKIQGGWFGFDVAVATPDMMGVVGKIGRLLGPKGLMPNPKTGTVTMEISKAVSNAKSGQVNYRVDKKGIIHAPVGKVSFDAKKLEENIIALVKNINKQKPASAKGKYIKNATIALTMSPSLTLDAQELIDVK